MGTEGRQPAVRWAASALSYSKSMHPLGRMVKRIVNAHIFLWIYFRSNSFSHDPIFGSGISPGRAFAWLSLFQGGLHEADRNSTCGFSGSTLQPESPVCPHCHTLSLFYACLLHISMKVRAFNDGVSIKNSIYSIKYLLSVYLPVLPSSLNWLIFYFTAVSNPFSTEVLENTMGIE